MTSYETVRDSDILLLFDISAFNKMRQIHDGLHHYSLALIPPRSIYYIRPMIQKPNPSTQTVRLTTSFSDQL
jgi:hypothetical protein